MPKILKTNEEVSKRVTSVYDKIFDKMEKKFSITSSELFIPNKLSSGFLTLDLISAGGIAPGTMVTVSGAERSSKSTSLFHYEGQAVRKNVPMISHFDAEGSASDPDYIKCCTGFDSKTLYTGTNESAKKVHLYPESGLEDFYNTSKFLMRSVPDKYYKKDLKQWFQVFDADPAGRAKMAEFDHTNYNKTLFRENGRLWCETEPGLQGLIFCDSYAMLLIKVIDENDEQKQLPAMAARAFSDNLKKIIGIMTRKAFSIYGINQLRTNPMPMYGSLPTYEPCFTGGTTVITENSIDTIRNIVLNKKKLKVLSFDTETGITSFQSIIDWKKNGYVPNTELLKIHYLAFDQKGLPVTRNITCTKNHKIWTDNGWKKAKQLKINDIIYTSFIGTGKINNDKKQIIYGSLLGDSSIEVIGCKTIIHYSHVRYQRPYLVWKGSYIDNETISKAYTVKNGNSTRPLKMRGKLCHYDCKPIFDKDIAEKASILQYKKTNVNILQNTKSINIIKNVIDKLKLLGLAVWYMDDGHFNADSREGVSCHIACSRFPVDVRKYAANKIENLTGLPENSIVFNDSRSGGSITIEGKNHVNIFLEAIKPYMHSSMAYKVLDPSNIETYELSKTKNVNKITESLIKNISKADEKSEKIAVFDLTVANNNTYFVGSQLHERTAYGQKLQADGLAVSNCGDALKFASSVRNQNKPRGCPPEMFPGVSPSGQKTNAFGQEPSVYGKGYDKYHYITVVNTKNRLGTPNMTITMRVWFRDGLGNAHGYDVAYDTYNYLEMTGRIEGSPKRGIKINLPECKTVPKMTWDEFKLFILCHTDPVLMKRAREYFKSLKTIPNIRQGLFKEIRTKEAYKLLVEGVSKATEDLEA